MYRFQDLDHTLRPAALQLAGNLVRRWRSFESYAPHKSEDELWEDAEAAVCDPHNWDRLNEAAAALKAEHGNRVICRDDLPPRLRHLLPHTERHAAE
ncbi:MAG TPA: hypothetical protein VEY95_18345 [Azospirillaceae bacterium]|nr:hypothetical protein [Azospirillaceae bacterium]